MTGQMAGNRGTWGRQYWGARVSAPDACHRIHGPPTGPVRREELWAVYEMVFQNFVTDGGSKETGSTTF